MLKNKKTVEIFEHKKDEVHSLGYYAMTNFVKMRSGRLQGV